MGHVFLSYYGKREMKLNFMREIWVDVMQTLTAGSAYRLSCTPVALEQSQCVTVTTVRSSAEPVPLCLCSTPKHLHWVGIQLMLDWIHKWTNASWAPVLSMTLLGKFYKLCSDILEKNRQRSLFLMSWEKKRLHL